jgi:hypothetical protein
LALAVMLLGPAAPPAPGLAPRPPGSTPIDQQLLTTPPLDPTRAIEDGAPAARQRTIAVGMFSDDVSTSYVPQLREIAALGATHVSLLVPLFQTSATSTDLALHTRWSPTLELIADTVRAARREHLEVTLSPLVRLLNAEKGQSAATLAPADRDTWFAHYGDLLGDLAAVAAQTGATRLRVAHGLSSLDGDVTRWRPLLERIRAVFPGKLTASATAEHYRDAKLFDLVDEEDVMAAFPLRPNATAPATDAALDAVWARHKKALLDWHAGRAHPLTLTIGYRSRAGATIAPADDSAGGPVDLEEQRRAFAAFRRAWAGDRKLDGVTIETWYGPGGATSAGATPRGKPAEQEAKKLLESF